MKFSSPHSSYIDTATPILKYLKKETSVSKISLGIIKPKKSMSKTLSRPKIILNNNHILIRINSKLYNQEIRIYGKDLELVSRNIQKVI